MVWKWTGFGLLSGSVCLSSEASVQLQVKVQINESEEESAAMLAALCREAIC